MTSFWPYLLLLLLLIIGVALVTARRLSSLTEQTRELKTELGKLAYHNAQLEEALHEMRTSSMGMGRKVKELDVQLQHTHAKTEELADLDPDTKMYNMANKMLESGADIEEIMAECEIPRAEAELLYNLYHQQPKTDE